LEVLGTTFQNQATTESLNIQKTRAGYIYTDGLPPAPTPGLTLLNARA
jgi:hypothetical protein